MQQNKIRHILVRHEQGAGFMAIGAARVTGRAGTIFSTAGPGALNGATAMGEAYGDSVPLLNIMAEDMSQYLYQDRGIVHESQDQFGVFSRLSQWSKQVSGPGEIPAAIHEGLRRTQVNRPRPVVVEIPVDFFTDEAEVDILRAETHDRPAGDPADIQRAARVLAEAERPLIWAGGGTISSGAWAELQSLAERLDAPVITTSSGKGSIPEDHPLSVGNLANQGPVKRLMSESDAMLAVGARFGYLPTAKWSIPIPQRLIHVDIDPTQPGKNFPVEIGVHADARLGLQALIDALDGAECEHGEWVSAAQSAHKSVWDEMDRRAPVEMAIQRAVRQALPDETIIAADPHLLGYWGRSFIPVNQPRTWLYDLAFGTLGYAFPVALGAKLVAPDKPVVALTGDGGFLFTSQELATAVPAWNQRCDRDLQRQRLRRYQGGLPARLRPGLRGRSSQSRLRQVRRIVRSGRPARQSGAARRNTQARADARAPMPHRRSRHPPTPAGHELAIRQPTPARAPAFRTPNQHVGQEGSSLQFPASFNRFPFWIQANQSDTFGACKPGSMGR